jgi:hypothetical protein
VERLEERLSRRFRLFRRREALLGSSTSSLVRLFVPFSSFLSECTDSPHTRRSEHHARRPCKPRFRLSPVVFCLHPHFSFLLHGVSAQLLTHPESSRRRRTLPELSTTLPRSPSFPALRLTGSSLTFFSSLSPRPHSRFARLSSSHHAASARTPSPEPPLSSPPLLAPNSGALSSPFPTLPPL